MLNKSRAEQRDEDLCISQEIFGQNSFFLGCSGYLINRRSVSAFQSRKEVRSTRHAHGQFSYHVEYCKLHNIRKVSFVCITQCLSGSLCIAK